jgi:hypothetical protein
MPTYDPQRSRSRPRAADDDTPAPVDEILGAEPDTDAPSRSFDEPAVPEPASPTTEPLRQPASSAPRAPTSPRGPLAEPTGPPAGATGLPREALIGFAAAVLVVVALVLRRRRRRRRASNAD